MKLLDTFFASVVLFALAAGTLMAAPDAPQASEIIVSSAGGQNPGHMANRSTLKKMAQACKAVGQSCNSQACPPTGRKDFEGGCQSNCCAGLKCNVYPAQPGSTGYGPYCEQ